MLETGNDRGSTKKSSCYDELTMEIAGFVIRIGSQQEEFIHKLRDGYRGFLSDRHPDLNLETVFESSREPRFYGSRFTVTHEDACRVTTRNLKADVDLASGTGSVGIGTRLPQEEILFSFGVFLASLCSIYLAQNGGLILHALGVAINDNEGCIFFGPSEAGKTTVGKLTSGYRVLNDERVAIRITGSQALMHNTPFWNRRQSRDVGRGLAVKAIFILNKASDCYAVRIDGSKAIAGFMNELYSDPFSQLLGGHLQLRDSFELKKTLGPRNHQLSKAIFNNFCELALIVPCYDLYFSKDGDALWRCLNELF
jgi:hypothetical protein